MTPKKTKTKRAVPPREKNVQVRLTEDEHDTFMKRAREEDTSAGKIVRKLLKEAGYI